MPLNDSQIERYSRQIILPELGGIGQQKLSAARVRVTGEGALVDWASLYLAAAGVGGLWLPESAAAVAREIARLEPDCRVTLVAGRAEVDVTLALSTGEDTEGRLVIAHAAGNEGWLSVVDPADSSSACVACLCRSLRDARASGVGPAVPAASQLRSGVATDRESDAAGTAGATQSASAMIALLGVTETLKLILGLGSPLVGRRLAYDAASQTFVQETVACGEGCKSRAQRRVSAAR